MTHGVATIIIFPFRRHPYNWKTPTGYFCAITSLTFDLYINFSIYFSVIAYFYGICRFLLAYIDDIKFRLRQLQREIELGKKSSLPTQQLIHAIIQFHVDVRQLSGPRAQLRCVRTVELCCLFIGRLMGRCSDIFNNTWFAYLMFGGLYWVDTLAEIHVVSIISV